MKKHHGILIVAVILSLVIISCAAPAPSPAPTSTVTVTAPAPTVKPTATPTAPKPKIYTIRISCENAPTYAGDGIAWTKFKQLMEERSKGRVKVDVFFSASLYGNLDVLPALVAGTVEMGGPSAGQLGEDISPTGYFPALPSFFGAGIKNVLRILNETEVGKGVIAEVERRPVKVLGFWNASDVIWVAKKPIHLPSDLAGIKIRVSGGALPENIMKAWGASPVTIASGEVYLALKQGVIDGALSSVGTTVLNKLTEVTKNVIYAKASANYRVLMTGRSFWDNLPADLQSMVQSTMNEVIPLANDSEYADVANGIKEIERVTGNPVYYLTDAETKAFRDAAASVEDPYIKKYGLDTRLLKIGRDWLAANK